MASQLVEGTRLAEQCPDVLAVQTQCLLAVLQRLLIQALPERSRGSASAPVTLPPPGLLFPSTEAQPPFPAEMEVAGGPGSGRRLQSSRKQLWCSHSGQGQPCAQLRGLPMGTVRTQEGGAFTCYGGKPSHSDMSILYLLWFRTPWMENNRGTFEKKSRQWPAYRTECEQESARPACPGQPTSPLVHHGLQGCLGSLRRAHSTASHGA